MAQNHEDMAAELHQTLNERVPASDLNAAGGHIPNTAGEIQEKNEATYHSADVEHEHTPEGGEPSDHERRTLRHIGENLPASAYLIAIVELTERFAYYGAQGLFQNYINNPTDGSSGAAGLGMGHQAATGLNLFFQWFCYVTPILGAIIADQYLGKYRTILIFAGCYWVGLLILWTTALPGSLAHGAGIGGYVTAIVVIAFGTGGIKSNIAPLIADQYQRRVMALTTTKTGERVVIDPAITYQRIYMVFYWCINLGSLSLIATPFMEKYEGFWSPFLMCFIMFNVGILVLILRRKSYVIRPPQGSIITDAFKAIGMMIKNRNMDAAKPSWRVEHGNNKPVAWNDHFVEEIKRALRACKVFVFYPVFWVCYGQFSSNFVTQAGQMNGHGMPNDFMQNFDPISILIFTPLLEAVIYPIMRRHGYELRPIKRITIGFVLAAMCLAYAAIVQHLVYSVGPCYKNPAYTAADPSVCPAGFDGDTPLPQNIHIAVQAPAYIFIGLAEIFISVTGLEYAYTKAPPSMKSFVQSMYLFTNAFGSALNEALVPVLVDPKFLWMYVGISLFTFGTAIVFWFTFKHYDAMEQQSYDLDRDVPILTHDGIKKTEDE
ncbi:hypothetical protein B0A48_12351 [Cryoendolithus antarcticus]|uniref:Peptide transporter PTR2 n=1 Tax=Cryoendolithus antarcticus TaxID=1507870 RepID=A0A1V8SS83_9PEZI|nr:hypothetical protein B0A48_12351 [Cryoendolithus antarcticus]